MEDEKVLMAAELELMTPDERHRLLSERTVKDLSQVPPAFLDEVRANARTLLEKRKIAGSQLP